MKSLLLLLLFAGVVSYISAACQNDVDTCKAAFQRGLPGAAGNAVALCNLGNTYISCLRNLTDNPACASLKSTITEYRRKTEQLLNQNATGCLLCTSEVDTCKTTFQNSASQAGNDITTVCKDGQTMILCLRKVDSKTECASEKARIEEERRKAEEKLTQAGCDTGHSCLQGIEGCQKTESSASKTANTHAQECTVANNFYNCLNGQTCTGEYQKHLKQALDQLVAEAKAGNCTFTAGGDGGGAGHLQHSSTVLVFLVMTAIALLK